MGLPELKEKIISASSFDGKTKIKFKQLNEGVFLYINSNTQDIDQIVKLNIK